VLGARYTVKDNFSGHRVMLTNPQVDELVLAGYRVVTASDRCDGTFAIEYPYERSDAHQRWFSRDLYAVPDDAWSAAWADWKGHKRETIYVAPGHAQCRVYALPYHLKPGQVPSDIRYDYRKDWQEIGLLNSSLHVVCLELDYQHLRDDLEGLMGGAYLPLVDGRCMN
jgi:hypothetical protein